MVNFLSAGAPHGTSNSQTYITTTINSPINSPILSNLSHADASIPGKCVLHPAIQEQAQKTPKGDQTLTPLPWDCIAVASALENWIGLGPIKNNYKKQPWNFFISIFISYHLFLKSSLDVRITVKYLQVWDLNWCVYVPVALQWSQCHENLNVFTLPARIWDAHNPLWERDRASPMLEITQFGNLSTFPVTCGPKVGLWELLP